MKKTLICTGLASAISALTFSMGSAMSSDVPSPEDVQVPLPPITATIPPIKVTAPSLPTITLPGRTITVSPSPINVPVPTGIATLIPPRPTKTVTERPPRHTQTVPVPMKPRSEILGGQTPQGRGTVVQPAEEPEIRNETRTKTDTIVKRILLGTLLSILFFVIGVAALFIGYYLGGRDAYRKDDKFMKGLLDRATYRRKH